MPAIDLPGAGQDLVPAGLRGLAEVVPAALLLELGNNNEGSP